jgi:phage baseplate assembly protein W
MSSRNRKKYSFKSSGNNLNDIVEANNEFAKNQTKRLIPIGIKTPLQLSTQDSLFEMHTDISNNISDNLRNLISTNKGERLGRYDYGANLRTMLMEFTNLENFENFAVQSIKQNVTKYMPFVTLGSFQTFSDKTDNENVVKVGIRLSYYIYDIDDKERMIEIMLYAGG